MAAVSIMVFRSYSLVSELVFSGGWSGRGSSFFSFRFFSVHWKGLRRIYASRTQRGTPEAAITPEPKVATHTLSAAASLLLLSSKHA